MLANRTGPFYVTMPDSANGLITVNPSLIPIPTSASTPVTFTVNLVNGACVKSTKSIPITTTDAATNATATVLVTVQDTDTSNDTDPNCF
jgi:hypothetical protein